MMRLESRYAYAVMSTFASTFLGHQGWMIRSGRSCVLVDPLLFEQFGAVHALEYSVHPPRVFGPERFPPVDAVILSHEHDDHFDIPSLARLDRRIPVFISAHSSTAAQQIMREMGFVVRPLVPGVPLDIGELQVIPFSGDHFSVNCADEWDALPYWFAIAGTLAASFPWSTSRCFLPMSSGRRPMRHVPDW